MNTTKSAIRRADRHNRRTARRTARWIRDTQARTDAVFNRSSLEIRDLLAAQYGIKSTFFQKPLLTLGEYEWEFWDRKATSVREVQHFTVAAGNVTFEGKYFTVSRADTPLASSVWMSLAHAGQTVLDSYEVATVLKSTTLLSA